MEATLKPAVVGRSVRNRVASIKPSAENQRLYHAIDVNSPDIGSLLGWIANGLPVVMCYTHEQAGLYISRIVFTAARRRWCEARQMILASTEEVAL